MIWGVGIGHWNYQHLFRLEDGVWSAICGAWMRWAPTSSLLPRCKVCERG